MDEMNGKMKFTLAENWDLASGFGEWEAEPPIVIVECVATPWE